MKYQKKRVFRTSYTFLIIVFIAFICRATEAPKVGIITFILGAPGEIELKHKDDAKWHAVNLEMDVLAGDVIKTKAESRLEIKLIDDSILRIGENTELEITEALIENRTKKINSTLKRGRIWANVTKLKGKNGEFQIKAPTAVCAVRGTIYRMDADTATTVLVYDGSIHVGPLWEAAVSPQEERPRNLRPVEIPPPQQIPPPYEITLDEWIEIVKGFQITVRPDRKYAKARFDEEEDNDLEWVRWNKQRDQILR
jgi:hypothetical protein